MRLAKLFALASTLVLSCLSAAAAASITGPAALALAAVVAPSSSLLKPAEKRAIAMLFAMSSDLPTKKKLIVTADKIVCRVRDVDITARSCQLTFGKRTKPLRGRAANELYATEAVAGVPPDGAAGSIYESLSRLNCTLDPTAIEAKDGGGATCTYEAADK
jgi:hypothetical protein